MLPRRLEVEATSGKKLIIITHRSGALVRRQVALLEKLCIEGKVGSTMYIEIGLKVNVIIKISVLILMAQSIGIK